MPMNNWATSRPVEKGDENRAPANGSASLGSLTTRSSVVYDRSARGGPAAQGRALQSRQRLTSSRRPNDSSCHSMGPRSLAYLRLAAGAERDPVLLRPDRRAGEHQGGEPSVREPLPCAGAGDLHVRRARAGGDVFRRQARPDFERYASAVVDWLVERPEIDPGRIGVIGRSLGGHYAPKSAAGTRASRPAMPGAPARPRRLTADAREDPIGLRLRQRDRGSRTGARYLKTRSTWGRWRTGSGPDPAPARASRRDLQQSRSSGCARG